MLLSPRCIRDTKLIFSRDALGINHRQLEEVSVGQVEEVVIYVYFRLVQSKAK